MMKKLKKFDKYKHKKRNKNCKGNQALIKMKLKFKNKK